ncbi:MAG: hypothetical protein KZQ95_14400 [Candidatus Thiodiazotropha sp. (ex Epidulcina cf. delphinae)]|nr:hypothetical protein [Candidatus Thiodiazotropha sp. (ex Epidulcina cf. delphinae)]
MTAATGVPGTALVTHPLGATAWFMIRGHPGGRLHRHFMQRPKLVSGAVITGRYAGKSSLQRSHTQQQGE